MTARSGRLGTGRQKRPMTQNASEEAGGGSARSRGGGALLIACAVALIAWRACGPEAAQSLAAAGTFAVLHPAAASVGFMAAYVALAALAVPAAWFMSLAAGVLFGPWLGVPLAAASATAGATVAMLLARHLFRDWIERRWPGLSRRLEAAGCADGAAALFAARLIPVLPFSLVNFAAGLSPMPARTFAAVTAVGVLPLASIYVLAGAELGTVSTPADILSVRTTAILAALAAGPQAALVFRRRRARGAPGTIGAVSATGGGGATGVSA